MQRISRSSVMNLMATTCARSAHDGIASGANLREEAVFPYCHREFVVTLGVTEAARHSATTGVEHAQSRPEEATKETR